MPEIDSMARPRIVGRVNHYASANGVAVDVAHEFEKVAVDIDEQAVIASLEAVSGGLSWAWNICAYWLPIRCISRTRGSLAICTRRCT